MPVRERTDRPALLSGHTSTVTSAVFSPDGRTLVTSSTDDTGHMWDTATGHTRDTLTLPTGQTTLAFSPDGHTLATINGGFGRSADSVQLWDIALPDQAAAISEICRAVHSLDARPVPVPASRPSDVTRSLSSTAGRAVNSPATSGRHRSCRPRLSGTTLPSSTLRSPPSSALRDGRLPHRPGQLRLRERSAERGTCRGARAACSSLTAPVSCAAGDKTGRCGGSRPAISSPKGRPRCSGGHG